MSHFMFRPLLHRATSTWYSCVRKGAVYLHIINDICAECYYQVCGYFGGDVQKRVPFYRVVRTDNFFCVRGTCIHQPKHAEGQQEKQQQLRKNLICSQYFVYN